MGTASFSVSQTAVAGNVDSSSKNGFSLVHFIASQLPRRDPAGSLCFVFWKQCVYHGPSYTI